MQTLSDRLKPDIRTLLEEEAKLYPHRTEYILDQLRGTNYVIDLPYGIVVELQALEGLRDTSPFDMFING